MLQKELIWCVKIQYAWIWFGLIHPGLVWFDIFLQVIYIVECHKYVIVMLLPWKKSPKSLASCSRRPSGRLQHAVLTEKLCIFPLRSLQTNRLREVPGWKRGMKGGFWQLTKPMNSFCLNLYVTLRFVGFFGVFDLEQLFGDPKQMDLLWWK